MDPGVDRLLRRGFAVASVRGEGACLLLGLTVMYLFLGRRRRRHVRGLVSPSNASPLASRCPSGLSRPPLRFAARSRFRVSRVAERVLHARVADVPRPSLVRSALPIADVGRRNAFSTCCSPQPTAMSKWDRMRLRPRCFARRVFSAMSLLDNVEPSRALDADGRAHRRCLRVRHRGVHGRLC